MIKPRDLFGFNGRNKVIVSIMTILTLLLPLILFQVDLDFIPEKEIFVANVSGVKSTIKTQDGVVLSATFAKEALVTESGYGGIFLDAEISEIYGSIRILSDVSDEMRENVTELVSAINEDDMLLEREDAPSREDARFFKVTGESMQPTLFEGDIIEIVSSVYEEGDVVVARTDNGNMVVKRFVTDALISDNPAVGVNFKLTDVTILGKASDKPMLQFPEGYDAEVVSAAEDVLYKYKVYTGYNGYASVRQFGIGTYYGWNTSSKSMSSIRFANETYSGGKITADLLGYMYFSKSNGSGSYNSSNYVMQGTFDQGSIPTGANLSKARYTRQGPVTYVTYPYGGGGYSSAFYVMLPDDQAPKSYYNPHSFDVVYGEFDQYPVNGFLEGTMRYYVRTNEKLELKEQRMISYGNLKTPGTFIDQGYGTSVAENYSPEVLSPNQTLYTTQAGAFGNARAAGSNTRPFLSLDDSGHVFAFQQNRWSNGSGTHYDTTGYLAGNVGNNPKSSFAFDYSTYRRTSWSTGKTYTQHAHRLRNTKIIYNPAGGVNNIKIDANADGTFTLPYSAGRLVVDHGPPQIFRVGSSEYEYPVSIAGTRNLALNDDGILISKFAIGGVRSGDISAYGTINTSSWYFTKDFRSAGYGTISTTYPLTDHTAFNVIIPTYTYDVYDTVIAGNLEILIPSGVKAISSVVYVEGKTTVVYTDTAGVAHTLEYPERRYKSDFVVRGGGLTYQKRSKGTKLNSVDVEARRIPSTASEEMYDGKIYVYVGENLNAGIKSYMAPKSGPYPAKGKWLGDNRIYNGINADTPAVISAVSIKRTALVPLPVYKGNTVIPAIAPTTTIEFTGVDADAVDGATAEVYLELSLDGSTWVRASETPVVLTATETQKQITVPNLGTVLGSDGAGTLSLRLKPTDIKFEAGTAVTLPVLVQSRPNKLTAPVVDSQTTNSIQVNTSPTFIENTFYMAGGSQKIVRSTQSDLSSAVDHNNAGTSLFAGTDYYFAWETTDMFGQKALSAITKKVTVPKPPAPGTVVPVAGSSGETSLVVSWGANGNGPTVTYKVERREIAPSTSTLTVVNNALVGVSFTDSGLVNNKRYEYMVTTVNSDGDPSTKVSIGSGYTRTRVGVLTPLVATDGSPEQIEFRLTGVPGDTRMGDRVKVYQVNNASGTNDLWNTGTYQPLTGITPKSGLAPNTMYWFNAITANSLGISSASVRSAPVSIYTRSAVPTLSVVLLAGETGVTGSHVVIGANGNPDGTRYLVERSTNEQFTADLVTVWNMSAGRTFDDTSLVADTNYYYRVYSFNQEDVRSSASTTSAILTRKFPAGTATINPDSAWYSNATDYKDIVVSTTANVSPNEAPVTVEAKVLRGTTEIGSFPQGVFLSTKTLNNSVDLAPVIQGDAATLSNQNFYMKLIATNKYGLKTEIFSKAFRYDMVNPIIDITTAPNNRVYKKVHTVVAKMNDTHSGMNKFLYKWTTNVSTPLESDMVDVPGMVSNVARNIATPDKGSGTYYLHLFAKDNVGKITNKVSEPHDIDNTAPLFKIASGTILPNVGGSDTQFTVSFKVEDVHAGLDPSSLSSTGASYMEGVLVTQAPNLTLPLSNGLRILPSVDGKSATIWLTASTNNNEYHNLNFDISDIVGNKNTITLVGRAILPEPDISYSTTGTEITSRLYYKDGTTRALTNVVDGENVTSLTLQYVNRGSLRSTIRVYQVQDDGSKGAEIYSKYVGVSSLPATINVSVPTALLSNTKNFTLLTEIYTESGTLQTEQVDDFIATTQPVLVPKVDVPNSTVVVEKGTALLNGGDVYEYMSTKRGGNTTHIDAPIIRTVYKVNSFELFDTYDNKPVYVYNTKNVYFDGKRYRELSTGDIVPVADQTALVLKTVVGVDDASLLPTLVTMGVAVQMGDANQINVLVSDMSQERYVTSVTVRSTTEKETFSPHLLLSRSTTTVTQSKVVDWDLWSGYSMKYTIVHRSDYTPANWRDVVSSPDIAVLRAAMVSANLKTDYKDSVLDFVLTKGNTTNNTKLSTGLIAKSGEYLVLVEITDPLNKVSWGRSLLNVVFEEDAISIPISNTTNYAINSNFLVNKGTGSMTGFSVPAILNNVFSTRGVLNGDRIYIYSIGDTMLESFTLTPTYVSRVLVPNLITSVTPLDSNLVLIGTTDGLYKSDSISTQVVGTGGINFKDVAMAGESCYAITVNSLYRYYNNFADVEIMSSAELGATGSLTYLNVIGSDIQIVTDSGEIIILN